MSERTSPPKSPQSYLPLTPPLFHVLMALADGDKHGYAIMKDVKQRTDGEVRLSAGTLYGIIKRLVASGMIRELDPPPGMTRDDARRRRSYHLEPLGREVARAEAERLERMLSIARAKNLFIRPEPA